MREIMSYISDNEKLSIRSQCDFLEVNRSNLYYKIKPESEENLEIMRLMDEHCLYHPTHGVLQVQDFLFALNFLVNHKRVRRLLRKMGIMAIYPKKNLSKLGNAKYIRPYLLRNLEIEGPNHVWAIDITYVPMKNGFMYLTAIIDLYSRYIVGWGIHNTLEAENTLEVFQHAIKEHGKPKIINSDQGSQFTCPLWTEYVEEECKVKISMDGKGRAIDNIFIERFWRTIKRDYIYLNPASSGTELFHGINRFISYYNDQKTHQGIGRVTPGSLYQKAA